jgi:hypothetical protein
MLVQKKSIHKRKRKEKKLEERERERERLTMSTAKSGESSLPSQR